MLAEEILGLLGDSKRRAAMQQALGAWHRPEAAAQIADRMLHWSARAPSVPAAGAPEPNTGKLGVLNV